MDKLLCTVWAAKKSKVKLDILELPWVEGGMGLLDLFLHYAAIQLQHAVSWFDDDDESEAGDVEPRLGLKSRFAPLKAPELFAVRDEDKDLQESLRHFA